MIKQPVGETFHLINLLVTEDVSIRPLFQWKDPYAAVKGVVKTGYIFEKKNYINCPRSLDKKSSILVQCV